MRKDKFVPILKQAVPLTHNPLAGGLQVVNKAWTAEQVEACRTKYLARAQEIQAELDARTVKITPISASAEKTVRSGWMPSTKLGASLPFDGKAKLVKRIFSKGAYSCKEYVDPAYAIKKITPEEVRAELQAKGMLQTVLPVHNPEQVAVSEQALKAVLAALPEMIDAEDFSKAA
jgi:hypothetical protein